MEKLPVEFKTKWVAALRNGEYKQARRTIYDSYNKSYCCIGVAAVLCGIDPSTEGGNDAYRDDKLPKAIRGGFSNKTAIQLMELNDSGGKSFLEIADYIEQNL